MLVSTDNSRIRRLRSLSCGDEHHDRRLTNLACLARGKGSRQHRWRDPNGQWSGYRQCQQQVVAARERLLAGRRGAVSEARGPELGRSVSRMGKPVVLAVALLQPEMPPRVGVCSVHICTHRQDSCRDCCAGGTGTHGSCSWHCSRR